MGLAESFLSLERTDGARLSLLVTTAAHDVRLVGRQKPGMVQAFFSRILSRGRNCRAVSYLGATAPTAHRRWIDDLSSTRDRHYRQLLFLQSTNDCVVSAVD